MFAYECGFMGNVCHIWAEASVDEMQKHTHRNPNKDRDLDVYLIRCT